MNKIDITRFSQPQGPVQIDWSNPITIGLYAVNLPTPTGIRELISGSTPSFSTNAKTGVGSNGVALEQVTGGTITNGVYIPKRVLTSRTEVIVALYPTLASYGSYLAATGGATADSIGSGLYNYRVGWTIHGASWNSYVNVFEGDAPFSLFGKNVCILSRWSANENNGLGKVVVNGVVITNALSSGFTGTCDRTQTTAQTVFGINQGSGSRLYLHASFNRSLSDVEAFSISQNPWQIFKPVQKQIFIPVNTQIYTPQVFDDFFTDSNAVGSSEDGSIAQGSLDVEVSDSINNSDNPTNIVEIIESTQEPSSINDETNTLLNYTLSSSESMLISEILELNILVLIPQVLRPDAQLQNSGWAGSYTDISESSKNVSTFISTDTVGSIVEYSLSNAIDPISSIGHLPTFTMSSDVGGVIIRLKQGTTVIATWTYNTLANTPTDYTPILSGTEIDSITDYNDLRISFESIY